MEFAFPQKRNKRKGKYKEKKRYPYKVGGRERIRVDSAKNNQNKQK